jgi:hypothetical protein
MLRDAVRTVLDTDWYRLRATAMAEEFQLIDTRSEILRAISEVSQNSSPLSSAAAKKVSQYRPRRAAQC